jgi:ATP-dependent DNA helicase RecQ
MLSEYVQEVGRAGRDGKLATALTLISEPTGWLDSEDQQRRQFFEQQLQNQQRLVRSLVNKLPQQGTVAAVSQQFKDGAIALSLLYSTGRLEWLDPFHYAIRPGKKDAIIQSNTHAARQMANYLKTRECRWRVLLRAFGFSAEAQEFRCGHCDSCDRSQAYS